MTTEKPRKLKVGTTVVYKGGSRSRLLRKGQRAVVAGLAPNANGTWRYNVRATDRRGEPFSTWIAARYVRSAR